MPDFRLPLSGNVTQSINPGTVLFKPWGNQVGLININLGRSANPSVEEEVLTDIASYGRQLGRVEGALVVLLKHFRPAEPLLPEDKSDLGSDVHAGGDCAGEGQAFAHRADLARRDADIRHF